MPTPFARLATTTGVAALVAAAGVVLAPSAAADVSLPAPTVAPGTVSPGGSLTISGTGCSAATVGQPVTGVDAGISYGQAGDGKSITPDAQGNWSVQLTLPATLPSGKYTVSAYCGTYNGDIAYPQVQATVGAGAATVTKATNGVVTVTAAPGQSLTPDAPAAPGEVRVLKLTGYAPGEVVKLVLHSTPRTIGTFTADAQGVVTARFSVPAGTPAGAHELKVTRADGSVVSYPVSVAAGKRLASTGADVTVPLIAGSALVVAGAGALVASRRRASGAARN
ncbi:hypothetical protein ACI78T_10135 [Blastococcus sp. SYSU D00922]